MASDASGTLDRGQNFALKQLKCITSGGRAELGARERGGHGLMTWWKKLPYLDTNRWLFGYFFCGLFIFIFGGVTGIIMALVFIIATDAFLLVTRYIEELPPVSLTFAGFKANSE